jgi:chemotaxis-related protein WspB
MTFVAFSIDDRGFALPATDVVAVVPAAPLRGIDGAPAWVAGILSWFDEMVPVVDLCALQAGRPCRKAFSTRIVIVRYPAHPGIVRPLGLLAERVTDAIEVDSGRWQEIGLATPETPWLGPMTQGADGAVQRVTVSALLPDEVRARLFP